MLFRSGPKLANNVEGGASPVLGAAELQAIGYAAVVFPVAATYAVARTLQDLMAVIKRDGHAGGFQDRMVDFETFNNLVGLGPLRQREGAAQDFAKEMLAKRRKQ